MTILKKLLLLSGVSCVLTFPHSGDEIYQRNVDSGEEKKEIWRTGHEHEAHKAEECNCVPYHDCPGKNSNGTYVTDFLAINIRFAPPEQKCPHYLHKCCSYNPKQESKKHLVKKFHHYEHGRERYHHLKEHKIHCQEESSEEKHEHKYQRKCQHEFKLSQKQEHKHVHQHGHPTEHQHEQEHDHKHEHQHGHEHEHKYDHKHEHQHEHKYEHEHEHKYEHEHQ